MSPEEGLTHITTVYLVDNLVIDRNGRPHEISPQIRKILAKLATEGTIRVSHYKFDRSNIVPERIREIRKLLGRQAIRTTRTKTKTGTPGGYRSNPRYPIELKLDIDEPLRPLPSVEVEED